MKKMPFLFSSEHELICSEIASSDTTRENLAERIIFRYCAYTVFDSCLLNINSVVPA